MVWAFAGNPNTFRIKIWSVGGGGAETVLYDNLTLLPFGGGTIILLNRSNPEQVHSRAPGQRIGPGALFIAGSVSALFGANKSHFFGIIGPIISRTQPRAAERTT